MSNEERILTILETLTGELQEARKDLRAVMEELREVKTVQDTHTRLLDEQTKKLSNIEEALHNQTKHSNNLSERLDYFERKYTGMGA